MTGAGVSGFRYLVQEDTTYEMNPASPPALTDQLGLNFHKSFHPIAQNGGQGVTGTSDDSSVQGKVPIRPATSFRFCRTPATR